VKEVNLIRGAKVLVDTCGNVQAGEDVLIVADTEKLRIAKVVAMAAVEKGAEVTVALMNPRSAHGQEPPAPIAAAMLRAGVIYAPTTYSLFHTDARREAVKAGARFLNMVDYDEQMLVAGGLMADFFAMKPVAERIGEIFTRGRRVEVTSPLGTRVVMDITGRSGFPQLGMSREPGTTSSPPDIESAVGPLESTAEGIIIVDGSIPHPDIGVIEEPIELRVGKGRILEIRGGKQAQALRKLLEGAGEDSVYVMAELGIGLNPQAKICGRMLEDEGVYGSVHFGFGDNRSLGGVTKAPMHLDAVILKPTVTVDGVTILQEGEFIKEALR
jgi:2,5-dihydroxypyridine 5,6-dioxygenase